MGARIVSFVRPGYTPPPPIAGRHQYADVCRAGLRWVRDAIGLLATATLLAWLVVTFAH